MSVCYKIHPTEIVIEVTSNGHLIRIYSSGKFNANTSDFGMSRCNFCWIKKDPNQTRTMQLEQLKTISIAYWLEQ